MTDRAPKPEPEAEQPPTQPANGGQQVQPAPAPPKAEDAAQYFSWVGKSADPDKIETA